MPLPYRILCLEDDPGDTVLMEHALKKENISFILKRVETREAFLEELHHNRPDIVLADYNLPTFNGLAALDLVRERAPQTPFILVSGTVGEEAAVAALKNGASDYLLKDRLSRLGASVRRSLQEAAALKEREKNLDQIAWLASFPERHPFPVIEMELSGRATYVNPAARDLFPDLLTQAFAHPVFKGLDVGLLSRQKIYSLSREVEVSGRVYHQAIHFLMDQQRLRFYMVDISERKHFEHLKDEFIGNVSHEMRTPLTIVKGIVENMLDDKVHPAVGEQLTALKIVESNCHRLAKIINNLLDLSRFESGRTKPKLASVDLVTLTQELLANFALQLKNSPLTIVFNDEKNLPQALVDADLIMQVLNNLLDNALRFAEKNIAIEISETGTTDKPPHRRYVQFSIINDGAKIEEEFLEQIFSKFFQVNRPLGEGYHGTGLGLAICREIITAHEGKIWAKNTDDGHVEFAFRVPVG